MMVGRGRLKLFQPALISLFGLGWLLVVWSPHPLVSSMSIILAETAMVLLAILSLRAFLGGTLGNKRFPVLVRNLVLLFIVANFLLLMPVISYNLAFGGLPMTFNYLLYIFPLEFALFTFLGVLPFTVAAYHFHARDRPEES
jgi:hypothetical protein